MPEVRCTWRTPISRIGSGKNRSFAAMAAFGEGPVNAGGGEAPERTYGAEVTQDFFNVMGVQPAIGRSFDTAEQRFRAAGTVVLGDGLWRRAYGGDPRILGRKIKLMGQPFTVIGVDAAGLRLSQRVGIVDRRRVLFSICRAARRTIFAWLADCVRE